MLSSAGMGSLVGTQGADDLSTGGDACASQSFSNSAAAAPPSDVCSYVPLLDTLSPEVRVLGEPPEHRRVLAHRPEQIVVESAVPVGAQFTDAGAIALDAADGDVSASLSRSGLSLVSTSAPTAPGVPFVVRYSAHDSSGNMAEPVERHVEVKCAQHELPCSLADGTTYCSVSDTQCIEPVPLQPVNSDNFVPPIVALVGP